MQQIALFFGKFKSDDQELLLNPQKKAELTNCRHPQEFPPEGRFISHLQPFVFSLEKVIQLYRLQLS